jgi:hypothetical protein
MNHTAIRTDQRSIPHSNTGSIRAPLAMKRGVSLPSH